LPEIDEFQNGQWERIAMVNKKVSSHTS